MTRDRKGGIIEINGHRIEGAFTYTRRKREVRSDKIDGIILRDSRERLEKDMKDYISCGYFVEGEVTVGDVTLTMKDGSEIKKFTILRAEDDAVFCSPDECGAASYWFKKETP